MNYKLLGIIAIGSNLFTLVAASRILGFGILLGADEDSDGCITSAGYVWCDELQECVRVGDNGCIQPENDLESSL